MARRGRRGEFRLVLGRSGESRIAGEVWGGLVGYSQEGDRRGIAGWVGNGESR